MSVSPELLEKLRQKSETSGSLTNSWECYAAILRYVHAALQRVPTLEALAACEENDIDLILEKELEYLASTVVEIFPTRGAQELTYYQKPPATSAIVFEWCGECQVKQFVVDEESI
ncbi:MAG: hypothetical protein ACRDHW_04365 [Ktedonobacteraceae bacterium]